MGPVVRFFIILLLILIATWTVVRRIDSSIAHTQGVSEQLTVVRAELETHRHAMERLGDPNSPASNLGVIQQNIQELKEEVREQRQATEGDR
jgi:hypothetical protein